MRTTGKTMEKLLSKKFIKKWFMNIANIAIDPTLYKGCHNSRDI